MIHGPIKYTFGKYRRQVSREKPPRYRSSSGRGAVSCFFAARNPLFSLEKRLYTRLISFKFRRPPADRAAPADRSERRKNKPRRLSSLITQTEEHSPLLKRHERSTVSARGNTARDRGHNFRPVLRERRQPNPRFNH